MRYSTRETIRFGFLVCVILAVALTLFLVLFDRYLEAQHRRHEHLERAAIIGSEIQVFRERWLEDVHQLDVRRMRLKLLQNPAILMPDASDPIARSRQLDAAHRAVNAWEQIVQRDEKLLRRLEVEMRRELTAAK